MRHTLAILVLCWPAVGSAMTVSPEPAQDVDPSHRVAYQRWSDAIEANPILGDAFWFSVDTGRPDLRTAVADLLSFGPNLTPFIVNELRTEKDLMRLYRLIHLLNRVSGINLYSDTGREDIYGAGPAFRDGFLRMWDAGAYLNATAQLKAVRKYRDEERVVEKIDPKSMMPIRRYGVFAIPFIVEGIEQHNSAVLFAAFLIISGEADLYADYIKNPSRSFPTRDQKLSRIKTWAAENESKFDKLRGLHASIKALTTR